MSTPPEAVQAAANRLMNALALHGDSRDTVRSVLHDLWDEAADDTRNQLAAIRDEIRDAVDDPDTRIPALYRLRTAIEALIAEPGGITPTRFEPIPDPESRFRQFPWVLRDNTTGAPHVPAGAVSASGFSNLAGAWKEADRLNRAEGGA